MFPLSANPRTQTLNELNPYAERSLSFCLYVEEVEPLQVSFELLLDTDAVPSVPLRTNFYKIGLLSFLLPNHINTLSKYFFSYTWREFTNAIAIKCRLDAPFSEFWKVVKSKRLSCIILRGGEAESEHSSLHTNYSSVAAGVTKSNDFSNS